MSSITSSISENTIKLDYLGSPVSHVARPYSNALGDVDTKSVGSKSVGSRTSKLTYSGERSGEVFWFSPCRCLEYPQVRPTNPLYSSTFTIRTMSSGISQASSTATVVERRKKFDPRLPKRPSDWRWFAVLCCFLFPLTGKTRRISSSSSHTIGFYL